MCLAIPMKIVEINEDRAIADMVGVKKEIAIQTLPRIPKLGEFVIVHAGFAIEIIDEEKAKETLGIFAEMNKIEDNFKIH